jgi:hypothetical protein
VLELLWGLLNKSLVVAEVGTQELAARYRMLEPVRQYAVEKLEGCQGPLPMNWPSRPSRAIKRSERSPTGSPPGARSSADRAMVDGSNIT